MIIDSDGNPIGSGRGPFPGAAFPRAPFPVRTTWALSFLALVVGVAAAMAFALWIALILIPVAIIASGIAGVIYRIQLARFRKSSAVSPRY
jgi:hypothetical protein